MIRGKQNFIVIVSAIVAIFAGTLFAQPSKAPPLSDRVPDDAFVFASWCGSDALVASPAYAQSHLKALLDSSNIRELLNDAIPRLMAKIAAKNSVEDNQALDAFKLISATLWKYPSATYFTIDLTGQPMPHAAIFARVGADAPAIQKQLDEIVSRAPNNAQAPVRAFVVDDIVGVSIGFDDGAASLVSAASTNSKPLSDADGFKKAIAHFAPTPADAALTVYVDTDALIALADKATMLANNPQAIETWPRVKEALGLRGLHHIAFSSGFDGKDWGSCAFIDAPSPRAGIFAIADHSALPDEALAMISASATSMSAAQMNFGHALEELHAMLGEIDAGAAGGFNMILGVAQMYTGVNLEKDLFANLGGNWLIYDDPQLVGEGAMGMVVVNKLADAEKAGHALDTIAQSLNKLMNTAMKGKDAEIAFRTVKSGEITVNYLAIPFVAPAWTIHEGYLYFSLFPQNTLAAAQRGKPAKSILENEKFAAMRDRLGAKQFTSIEFSDLPNALASNYQTMLLLGRTIVGGMDAAGARAPELVLPTMHDLAATLAPAGAVSWSDDAGFHWRSVTPFPGAAIVNGIGPWMFSAAPALFASITLPALSRARETANRVKCSSNLRQIGQAILLYANENKGNYPANLGALLVEDITPEVFLCPDTKKSVPANWKTMTKDQQEAWINEHSDYQYIGAGMNSAVRGEIIVAFERGNPHGRDGMNMLFGDGHVEFDPTPQATRMLAEQGDRKK